MQLKQKSRIAIINNICSQIHLNFTYYSNMRSVFSWDVKVHLLDLVCIMYHNSQGMYHNVSQFTRQEKHLKILLPSGLVHFQLPPLKYYLPKFMHALLMPYQLHNLPGTGSNE